MNISKFLITLLLVSNTGCGTNNGTNPQTEVSPKAAETVNSPANPISIKGYELYTWKDSNNKQFFALVTGTNREKTAEEIRAAGGDFTSLTGKISALGKGETVILTFAGKYASLFPAELTTEMKNELTVICNNKGINLSLN